MAEVIHGGADGNQLNASANKTQVYGLKGNDTLISDGKSDVLLVGGSGDDSLIMFGGNGTLSGGKGSDTFELTYSADKKLSAVIEDFEPSSDRIVVNHVGDTAPQLTSSVKGNDVIWTDGGNFNLTLKSVRENDYFDGDAPDEAWEVLRLTNAEREAEGLAPLTLSEGLMKGAATRANEITGLAQIGALSDHTRPESVGSTPYYTVLVDDNLTLKQKYTSPGENLDGGARTAEEVVIKDWMNSNSHRENILKKNYQKIGIGYNYYDEDKSDHRWYWTQLFANGLKSVSSVDASILSTASIESNAVSKAVTLTDNTYDNAVYGVTISGTSSADSISNSGLIASVSTGNGDDTITNNGANVTICAGTGEDSISLSSDAKENLILYAIGDGSDTINGINKDDTLSIVGGEYNRLITVDDKDIVVKVGDDSITLLNAAKAGVNVYGTESKLIRGAESGSNTISNLDDNVTIESGNGDDDIYNYGSNVIIDGGDGNDSIGSYGDSVTIDGGKSDNHIYPSSSLGSYSYLINDDTINNYGSNVSIDAGDGNDDIKNRGSNVMLNVGTGNDSIYNWGDSVSIDGGNGDDTIYNEGSNVTIDADAGNDYIVSPSLGSYSYLRGNNGNDTIKSGSNSTIDGGAGDDSIQLGSDNVIVYRAGDGNDTINNFDETSTLSISGGSYFRSTIVNDIVFAVGTDSIILLDAASLGASLNVLGEGQDGEYISGFIELTEDNDTFHNTLRGATIQALGGDDSITNDAEKVSIDGNDGNDTISHRNYNTSLGSGSSHNNVSITGGNGKDFITNNAWYVEIDAGNDDDTVASNGSGVTIAGGLGDDSISLSSGAWNNLIRYTKGDGNDTIRGFNEDDSLIMLEVKNDYSTQRRGNDFIVNVGDGSIALIDTAYLSTFNIEAHWIEVNKEGNLITLSAFNDYYDNTFEEVTIDAGDGDDSISNTAASVSVDGGDGDDTIDNEGSNVTIDGGKGETYIHSSSLGSSSYLGGGNDKISNYGSNVSIDAGSGDDSIHNEGSNVTINGGTGDNHIYVSSSLGSYSYLRGGKDTIRNNGDYVSIDAGDGDDAIHNGFYWDEDIKGNNASISGGNGNDSISNYGDYVSIDMGDGDDDIYNRGSNVSIDMGDDDDYISFNDGSNVSIDAGNGDDFISNGNIFGIKGGANVSIAGGAGTDEIYNSGDYATINSGTGNDQITLSSQSKNNLILYTPGDGDDTIWGLNADDRISINGGTYSTQPSGDDVIVHVGEDTIILKDFRDNPEHIIIGASETSGGTGNNGNGDGDGNGGGGSSGGNGGGGSSGGNGGGGSSGGNNGGGSSGGNNGGSSSGGNNGGGSSGGVSQNEGRGDTDATPGKSASGSQGSKTSRGNDINTGNRGDSNNTGSNINMGGYNSTDYRRSSSTSTPFEVNPFDLLKTQTNSATNNQHVYTGGNQVISDYQAGEKIIFGAAYTGALFDDANNFFVGSTTGAIVVTNAADKVIDLTDGTGNSFLKAYAATAAGIIDGRGLSGFEVIKGSAGADIIFAGDGSSSLWGGNGIDSDTLVGGGGIDIFVGGKNQGADIILNASATDVVFLSDSTLSDILASAEGNGAVAVAFNTGNVIAVQSTEPLSAAFMLADGSAYRYNHVAKTWQTA